MKTHCEAKTSKGEVVSTSVDMLYTCLHLYSYEFPTSVSLCRAAELGAHAKAVYLTKGAGTPPAVQVTRPTEAGEGRLIWSRIRFRSRDGRWRSSFLRDIQFTLARELRDIRSSRLARN